MTSLLSLYPRAWRERYGDEFAALLEARPPDTHDRIDIVRGAIDARLHPQPGLGGSSAPPVPVPYDGPWDIRRAGQVTLIGGVLYLVSLWLAINGPILQDADTTYRDGSGGFPTFFLAVTMLLLGGWAVAATLPRASRLARSGMVVGAIAGLVWAVAPWMLPIAAILGLSLIILAIEAARTRRWRWSDTALLIGGIAGAVGVAVTALAAAPSSIEALPMYPRDLQFVALALLSPAWFATAHALLRPAIPVADRAHRPSAA